MEENCIFCKIIKGEIPSDKVYEDENILAFKDINPAAPIHVLVIPKKHVENILSIEDENMLKELYDGVKKVVQILNIKESGFRIITNCGKDAGQEVMHLHFHVLAGEKLGEKIK